MTQPSQPARRGLLFVVLGIAILGGLIGFFLDEDTNAPADPFALPPLPELLLIGAVALVVLFVFVVRWWIARSIRRTLDEAFGLMGLQPSSPALGLRGYQGEYNGFPIEVSQLPGPAITIQVRGRFGPHARVRLGQADPISFADADLAHLSAASGDEAWLATLLAGDESREAVLGLLGEAGAQGVRWIAMKRDLLLVYLKGAPVQRVTAEDARGWVYQAVDLAKAVQALAPESAPDDAAPEALPADFAPAASSGSQPQRAIILAIALAIAALSTAIVFIATGGP
jgi:hypothetical protein